MTINIESHRIGPNQPTFIIAEAGVNHNGELRLAMQLIEEAAKAGADAIKFQTFRAEQVVTEKGRMAVYQKENLGEETTQRAMLKKLELSEEYYSRLLEVCRQCDIIFLSTPHGGFESVDLLEQYNIPAYKIGSPDINNLPLLAYIAKTGKPIILATGASTMREVRDATTQIEKEMNRNIILLHCTSNYPCPLDQVNLRAMQAMQKIFPYPIGYSDHTEGIDVTEWAVLLGATVIEKHLTLDRNLPGPDQKSSIEPSELARLVSVIRSLEKLPETQKKKRVRDIPRVVLGSAQKEPTDDEKKMMPDVRKSLVWARNIEIGQTINPWKDIEIKRPAYGLPPALFWNFEGKTLRHHVRLDSFVRPEDIE